MLDRIVAYSVHRPGPAISFAVALIFFAFTAVTRLPIDAVPDITNVQVQINTAVPALAPETIETNITYPIESAIGAAPHVEEVRSISRYGLSQVTVVFEEGTDIYFARQLLAELIQNVQLPEGVHPRMGPVSTGLGEIFYYQIEMREPAENPEERLRQFMELRTLQEWEIKRRLLTVPGVAEINTIGGHPEAYYVEPDPTRMALHGIHFDNIVQALEENNRNVGGGTVQQSVDQFVVHGEGLVRDLSEIRTLPVKILPDLSIIRMNEVARVSPGRELRTGAAVVNGKEAVIGTAFMLLGENSRAVSERVAQRLEEIRATLPEHVELRTLYDRSYLVEGTIETVRKNLLFGALLVIVMLFALTGNLRAAIITALVIPLSFAVTISLMYVTGVSANLMSLGALDFGIIIDGAVIVMDRCYSVVNKRAREKGSILTRSEIRDAVANATVEIRQAAGFGQLIILVVFIPIFTLTGIEGKMFRPMAAAFCFALLGAFVLAFTVVPALAGIFLSGRVPKEGGLTLFAILEDLHQRTLKIALGNRVIVLSMAVVLLGAGVFFYGRLGGEFIPQLYERATAFQFVRPVSIGIDASVDLEERSQKVILEFEEVENVFSRIGTSEIATDAMGVNLADTYVMFRPRSEWPEVGGRTRTPQELVRALQLRLQARVPGQRILVSQPIQLRFNELMEGTRADVNLKIYGEDLDELQRITEEATSIISEVPGVGDVEPEVRGKAPILVIAPKDDVLSAFGNSRRELLDALHIGIGGHEVGHLYRGVQRFPIYVRLSEKDRGNIQSIRSLPVGIEENFTAPLGQLATIEFRETFEMIKRDSFKRRGAVLINIGSRDTRSVVDDARALIEQELQLPEGYYLEWGGNFKNLEQARQRLAVATPVAFLIVCFMIYSAFQDWRRTLLVLSGVPFALIGGVLSLTALGLPFSVSAGVGFIALFGISVLNGVVLVHHYARLQARGLKGHELIRQGARDRLRAILMTALTDIFGFLPMMLATGLGAEVQRPLATVVVGGVLTCTATGLILLPLLHDVFGRWLPETEGASKGH